MKSTAVFYFYGSLNDLLSPARRGCGFSTPLPGGASAKHLIEALGVPHVEVHRLAVDGQTARQSATQSAGLDYLVQAGDRIEVFPAPPGQAARPLGAPRFVLDGHLGRLAAYLRMLGIDSLYKNEVDDIELAEAAGDERILLSRDRRLLMRKLVAYGYCLRSLDPDQQVREVVRRYGLWEQVSPFRRCLRCNAPLEPVSKIEIQEQLQPLTRQFYDEFRRCTGCGQLYWKGSHYDRMERLAKEWTGEARESEIKMPGERRPANGPTGADG